MSLGAAVGGFAQGLAGGLRLSSELQDAEQRRGLVGVQTDLAKTQLSGEQEKQESAKFARGVTEGYVTGNVQQGFVRNEDGSYDPNLPQNVQRYYDLSAQSSARFAAAHGQDPQKAIAEVEKLRKDKFAEGVNQAAAMYGMGNLEGGDAALRRVHGMYNDGRKFLKTEMDPANPGMVRLNYQDEKTGEVKQSSPVALKDLSSTIIPMGLDLTATSNLILARQDRDLKERQLQLSRDEFDSLKGHRKWQEDFEAKKWTEGADLRSAHTQYYKDMGRAALMKASTDKSAVDIARTTQALNNQLGSVTTLIGLQKNFDPKLASKEEIADHENKLAMANTAMYLVSNSVKNGNLTIDAPTAIRLTQAAENVPFSEIKSAGNGIYYANVQGVNVPLPLNQTQYKALEKANAAKQPTAAPAAPAKAGISAPGAASSGLPPEAEKAGLSLDAARRRLDAASTKLRSFGLRQRSQDPKGFEQAQVELDAAKQEAANAETMYQNSLPTGLRGPAFAPRP